MPSPLTVGHRGASALAPENSLRAFALAIDWGLDFAELDVHLSRDGEVIVIHDATLLRLFGDARRVADLDRADLRRLGVPTLGEVLDLVRGQMGLYVELKGARTGAAFGNLVARGEAAGVELIGGSFEPGLVQELREACDRVPRSVLFASATVEQMIETGRRVGAGYAHPCFRPITAEIADGLHAAGLQVMTPHTNEPDEARAFAEIGVDVIASDDPRVLQPLLVRA